MKTELFEITASLAQALAHRLARAFGGHGLQWVLCASTFLVLAWFISCEISEMRDKPLDDAYITYTYGVHLAEGAGFRFNTADEGPTEGFSAPLHVLIIAAATLLGLDPLQTTRALSLLAFLSVPFAFALAIRLCTVVPRVIALSAGLVGSMILVYFPETGFHHAWGMETILYTCTVAWACVWALYFMGQSRQSGIAVVALGWLALFVVVIGRPEGLLFAAGLLVVATLLRPKVPDQGHQPIDRALVFLAAGFVLAVGTFLIWKRMVFGYWLPNPYYVKVDNAIFGTSGALFPGLIETAQFVLFRYLPLAALTIGLARMLRIDWITIARATVFLGPSLLIIGMYVFTIHETARGYRYEYPYLVPLVGVLALLTARLWTRSRSGFALAAVAMVLCLPLLSASGSERLQWLRTPLAQATLWMTSDPEPDTLGKAALDLRDTGLGGEATILLSAAGQVPYFSGFYSIDWIGLNNNYLSGRQYRDMDAVWAYIESHRPDVVLSPMPPASAGIDEAGSDPAYLSPAVQASVDGRALILFFFWNQHKVAEMLYRQMRYIRDHYEFGAAYELWNNRALMIYVRRDSPYRQRILQVVAASPRQDPDLDLKRFYSVDPRELGGMAKLDPARPKARGAP